MSVVDRWVELDTSQAEAWRLVRDFVGQDSWVLSQGKKFEISSNRNDLGSDSLARDVPTGDGQSDNDASHVGASGVGSAPKNAFRSEGEDVLRSYHTDAGKVTEQLISIDDLDCVLRYTLTDSPIPVRDFRGSIAVSDNNDGTSSVFWRAEYSANPENTAEVSQFLGHWFERGLRNLQKLVRSSTN